MKYVSIALILLLCAGAYAFDEAGELTGTIHRPGHESLRTIAVKAVNSNYTYIANDIVGTPKAFTAQYYSPYKPSVANALVADFLDKNYDLVKNRADDFRIASNKFVLDKYNFINLIQTYRGVDIWSSRLGLRVTASGKIFFVGGETFTGIDINASPTYSIQAAEATAVNGIPFDNLKDKIEYGQLYVLPLIFDDKIEYHLCHMLAVETTEPLADWRVFVDAHDGSVLWRENVIRYETISGNISGLIYPGTPYDVPQLEPYPNLEIIAGGSPVAYTDANGDYSFDALGQNPVAIDLLLQGSFMNVNNEIAPDSWFGGDVNPGDIFNFQWNDDNSTMPERNAYYHGQLVHDFIKMIDPELDVMDFPMTCRVNVDGNCNAFYSRNDRSINFYAAGANCPNIALIGDVIYHEWGHGLTNLTYYYGGYQDPNGAMHEGFSDFLAGLITNQSLIGRGFYGPGSHLRNLSNHNHYPEDWSGESHNDGLIIGGALWDLKMMLDGDRPGYIDTLWQYAKYGFSGDFEGYFWDVLTTDDDDDNLDNGTPHAYEIYYSFGQLHGIGPGIPIEIEHTPVTDSEDSTVAYEIEAHVTDTFPMDNGSVIIHYTTGDFSNSIYMTTAGNDIWRGEIPNQAFGTTVNYYIEAIDNLNLRAFSPENAPDSVYSFFVGFDVIAPAMSEPMGPANTINLFGPYGTFGFSARDNHGIDMTSGQLHYKINNGQETIVPMPAANEDGEFALDEIDVGDILYIGDVISYYFTCRDQAIYQNTGRLPEDGFLSFEISSEELVGDFEGDLGDWIVQSDGWVYYDHQGYQSSDCIKTGEAYYENNLNSIIYLSRPLNLSLFDYAWLDFRSKHIISDGDTCFVIVANSADGPWTSFETITGNANTWRLYSTDLPGMAGPGNDSVYIGFQFVSDDAGNSVGILIDHVSVRIEEALDVESALDLPKEFSLAQNYPNPFNANTVISFFLPEGASVKLDIFDILGRKVNTLVDSELNAGIHQAVWNGRNYEGKIVTSGIYFYRLDHDNQHEIKSMTVIK